MVTARFLVGTDEDIATTRVHEKIRANIGDLPKGIPEPLIVGRGINDVAIVTLTLSASPGQAEPVVRQRPLPGRRGIEPRARQGRQRRRRLYRRRRPNQIRVEPDPEKLSVFGVTLNQLVDKISNANRSFQVGTFRDGGKALPVLAGQTLQGVPDIGLLLLTTRDGRPVYVKDVAERRRRRRRARATRLDHHPRRERRARAPPCRHARRRQAQGRERGDGRRRRPEAARDRARPRGPGGPRDRGHAQLRRDRDREGERASLPPRARDRLDRRADHARDRLARGPRRR